MGTLSYPFTLTAGQPENVNQLNSNLAAIATVLNGSVDATNLAAGAVDVAELASTLAAFLGVTQSGAVRRGKSIIATEESRSNTAYGLLATPDRVQNVVLPTDGLICVAFQGMWKSSASGLASAAIFIGSNQVKVASNDGGSAAPIVAEESGGTTPSNTYRPLYSTQSKGLTSTGATGAAYTGDVTTGQLIGEYNNIDSTAPTGVAYIFAAAGTYDVSIQFKASSGSVTAKERKLWVWTMGF